MVGLQRIADVAQLVERRLPKPRRASFAGVGADRSWSVLAGVCAANRAVLIASCGMAGFSVVRRSGVLVASAVAA